MDALLAREPRDAVFTTDLDGMITTWNAGAERFFGRRAATVLGTPAVALHGTSTAAHAETSPLEHAWSEIEIPASRGSKQRRACLTAATTLRDPSAQQPCGIATYMVDNDSLDHDDFWHQREDGLWDLMELARRALSGESLATVLAHGTQIVTNTLGVEYCAVLRLAPDFNTFWLQGGSGWGSSTIPAPAFYDDVPTASVGSELAPLVVEDLRSNRRNDTPFLREHNVASSLRVAIRAHTSTPWVLCAYATTQRQFSERELSFLLAMASVLEGAINRDVFAEQRTESTHLAATAHMATAIAHEINNPIAGLKYAFVLVREALPRTHRHYKYLRMIQQEIDRLALIVRQMFKLYQPETATRSIRCIEEALTDVTLLMETKLHQHEVTLEYTPGNADAMRLALPESHLYQVLYNVIHNAIDAAPPNTAIRIETTLSQDRAIIAISDQGAGIDVKLGGRIFEPFVTTKTGGMGLGLSISRNLVERGRGSLTLARRPEGGTTCRIALPLSSANTTA